MAFLNLGFDYPHLFCHIKLVCDEPVVSGGENQTHWQLSYPGQESNTAVVRVSEQLMAMPCTIQPSGQTPGSMGLVGNTIYIPFFCWKCQLRNRFNTTFFLLVCYFKSLSTVVGVHTVTR